MTSVFCQPSLGVVVIWPHVALATSKSTGPKQATPRASYLRVESHFATSCKVSAGLGFVGNSARSRMVSGSAVPIAATKVVPPPSTAAKVGMAKGSHKRQRLKKLPK